MPRDKIELVQSGDSRYRGRTGRFATPIFLIHDGGGTTYAYHCLESLQRLTYGIPNPYFFNGKEFEGGLAQMGELYTRWIRDTVNAWSCSQENAKDGRVDVFLGGWSLGGLLSLEIAKRLTDDPVIHVAGILMVDSIYPGAAAKKFFKHSEPAKLDGRELTKNQILSLRCLGQARRMLGEWQVPIWDGAQAGKRPRAVLLRATNYVSRGDGSIHWVDKLRTDKMLGWGDYDADMFDAVLDLTGHHFDLFSFSRIKDTTRVIRQALDILDGLAHPHRL